MAEPVVELVEYPGMLGQVLEPVTGTLCEVGYGAKEMMVVGGGITVLNRGPKVWVVVTVEI